ncbi:tyrosinase [Streptomyces tuirus]|uniref:Tyrosinase n=1 Tax=Streptomyces tuirus TaxID=68278 RepID=A0A941J2N1_9ACTN|nr:tyrosinase [Streptomyces tuirus]
MVVSLGGAPVDRTRRDVVRGLRAAVVAAALAPVTAASRPQSPGPGARNALLDSDFDEIYRDRRIRGVRSPAHGPAEGAGWHVTVDGRALHLMRRADGTWLSMVDHYCSYRSPREAARAAVDGLAPGRLPRDPAPAGAGHPHTGDRHGVHA